MSQKAVVLRRATALPAAPARPGPAVRGFGEPSPANKGGAGHSLSRIAVDAPAAEQAVPTGDAAIPESLPEQPEALDAAAPRVQRAVDSAAAPADPSGPPTGPPAGPPADGGDDESRGAGAALPLGAQAKLTVNTPGDHYEQEADAVADRVMRTADATAAPPAGGPVGGPEGSAEVQRAPSPVDLIHRREAAGGGGSGASGDVSGAVGRGLSGGGRPLDPATRAFMEPRFGQDFSGVRVHTDGAAALSARDVSARAYTLGSDVAFASGQYDPAGDAGRRLLAHELTHVVQQGSGSGTLVQRDTPDGGAPPQTAPPAAAAPSGGAAAGPALPDFSTMTWQQLLPHAHGAKGVPKIAKVTNAVGVAPTLAYPTDPKKIVQDPSAAAQSAGVGDAAQAALRQKAFAAAVDAAVAKIVAARAAVPHRALDRDPFSHKGNFYDPTLGGWEPKDDPKKKAADWNKERADAKKTDTQGADYKKWVDAATPTGLDVTKPDDLKKWQIFQATVPLEGHIGEFTTFDNTLSVGTGFSTAGGQAQKVIGKAFNSLPEVKSMAEAAGMLADGSGGMTIVDTSQKWILDGQDAAAYIQTDEALISLLVNTSQGTQPVAAPPPAATPPASGGGAAPATPDPAAAAAAAAAASAAAAQEQLKQRQAFLDAEYQTFLSNAVAGIPATVLAWPISSAVLAVHSRHGAPAYFPWSFWEAHPSSDLTSMVTAIYDNLKGLNKMEWLIPICDQDPYRSLADSVKKEKEAAAAKAAADAKAAAAPPTDAPPTDGTVQKSEAGSGGTGPSGASGDVSGP